MKAMHGGDGRGGEGRGGVPHQMTIIWQLQAGKALELGAGGPDGRMEKAKAFTWEKRLLNLGYKHKRYGKRHTYRVWGNTPTHERWWVRGHDAPHTLRLSERATHEG